MRSSRLSCGALAAFGVLAFGQSPAFAGDLAQLRKYHVNAMFDGVDASPGDGICAAEANPPFPAKCTLRAAVMEANTLGEGFIVEIILEPGLTYHLQISGSDENLSVSGDLDVTRAMRIGIPQGASPSARVDGHALDRVFDIQTMAAGTRLYGLEIQNGFAATGSAVSAWATTTAERLDVHHNQRPDGFGLASAIEVFDGAFTLRDSRVHHNGMPDHSVGGVEALGGDVLLTIERSTIDSNAGRGVHFQSDGMLVIKNSTISGNAGTGIFLARTALVDDTSVVRNGGQITFFGTDAELELRNSILDGAGRPGLVCVGPQSATSFVTAHNIYSDNSCLSDTFWDGSQHNADSGLSELGNWGGPTPTHKPLPGSIAIDWSPASLCAGTDQRGLPRPVAHSGNVEPRCDAGAVELEALVEPEDPWVPEIFLDGFEGEG